MKLCSFLSFVLIVLIATVTQSSLVLAAMTAPQTSGVRAQTPIEDQLVIQTPISPFIVDAAFKEFVRYAREKWNINVKTSAQHAGTPVSYDRVVKWKGKPEADIFWGGETALFDKLAEQKLLAKLELPGEAWEAIPATMGKPKPLLLKHSGGYWVGTALEIYGLAYHPRLLKRLGVAELKDWDDVLNPKLKGHIAQCTPDRSSSSHTTYEIILQGRGDAEGWKWLKRLAENTGSFTQWSRDVASVVARGDFAVGFAVPSYYAFEEKLAGFDIRFVAPRNAYVTPEPLAILVGAKHPQAARAFVEFLLSESGQRMFMDRGLFPVIPKYKVHGPPGSTAELAVELTGGMRSFFDAPVSNIYDETIASKRYRQVNETFAKEIESTWSGRRKK